MGAEQSTQAGAAAAEVQDGSPEQGSYPSALVVCGPSGVGKGTLIHRLMQGKEEYGFSCSHTTRGPRPGEQDGVDYHFTTKDQFESEIAEGKFLEYAHVHGNIYGTSIASVASVAEAGKCCVLDIDVQGARQVRAAGVRAIFVFIAPPSMEELEQRLRGRGTENEEQIQRRLTNAAAEMASMKEAGLYDYILVNSNLKEAARQLQAIGQRALAGFVGAAPLEGDSGAAPDAPPEAEEGAEAAAPAAAAATDSAEVAAEPGLEEAQEQAPAAAEAAAPEAAAEAAAEAAPAPAYLRTYEQHKGKVVVVTGAASAVGAALCKAMAIAGLKVVALAKTREGLQKLQKELVLDAGVSAANFLPIVCDTTKEAEVVAVPRIVVKRWPGAGVEILINNEDLAVAPGSLLEGSAEGWRETILESILSVCLCTREVVQDMQSRSSYGYIINLISQLPPAGPPSFQDSLVSATKLAVESVTEGLYRDVAARQLPIPVCKVLYGGDSVSTTAHIGQRTVQFSKAAQEGVGDVLEAVGWCLIN